ncbi:MAG: Gfo/Idh/MocA family protein [Bacteroidales bacterium]
MKLDEVRWAFIGCGNVTEKKSGPAFEKIEGSRVMGVFRRDREKALDYARRHGIAKVYDNVDQLLNDSEVNAVYVATPHALHKPYALMVAKAGKACYVEKPLGISYKDAFEIYEAFHTKGLPLFVAYYRRKLPPFVWLREFLLQGHLGKITGGELKFIRPARPTEKDPSTLPWRLKRELSGGGYLFDLGPHHIDYLSYVFEKVTVKDSIHENRGGFYEVEDYTLAHLLLGDDVPFEAEWNFAAPEGQAADYIRFTGERGSVEMPFFGPYPIKVHLHDKNYLFRIDPPAHVQQPLLETVVGELLGRPVQCPSTGLTALETNRILEEIVEAKQTIKKFN